MSSRGDSPDSFVNYSDEREEDGEDTSDEADVSRGAKRETFRNFKDLAQAQQEHKANFQILLRELEISYDTEEASEADVGKGDDYMEVEIQEQMYQDKFASVKKQLQQLEEGIHAEYNRKNKHLESQRRDRDLMNQVLKTYTSELMERTYVSEIKAAAKECEEKRVELKESLISEYDEKRRIIDVERSNQDLIGDAPESKPVMTRKLRRRPNDPLPQPEKRRKITPTQINLLLDEKDVEMDLKAVLRGRPMAPMVRRVPLPGGLGMPPISTQGDSGHEPYIEDGKLRYEKRFYHRGQPIFVSEKDMPRFAANIHTIGSDAVVVKKVTDSTKVRITLWHLAKKKIHIERRVP